MTGLSGESSSTRGETAQAETHVVPGSLDTEKEEAGKKCRRTGWERREAETTVGASGHRNKQQTSCPEAEERQGHGDRLGGSGPWRAHPHSKPPARPQREALISGEGAPQRSPGRCAGAGRPRARSSGGRFRLQEAA